MTQVDVNQQNPNPPPLLGIAPQPSLAQRRVIIYAARDAEVTRACDETQQILLQAGIEIYQLNGRLVIPRWEEFVDEDGRLIRATHFTELDPDKLRKLLNRKDEVLNLIYKTIVIKHSMKMGEVRWEMVVGPPDKMLRTLLAATGDWIFARVRGFVTAPTLRWDGSLLDQCGYDPATQLHAQWEDDLMLPEIPEKPSKEDADKALKVLEKDLLSECAFADESLDKAVALAALMTPVLHGAYRFCPMFMILAPVAGTGKSYLADMASNLANGRDAPVLSGSKDDVEMEKRLVSVVLAGDPLISIDNLSFDLNSDLLNQMLTQSVIKPRILGKSETPDCNWTGTIFATGNNVRLARDLTRRGLLINLDRKTERPQQHDYRCDPIHDRIHKNRGKYIAAILTIARAYLLSDEKIECTKFGNFNRWSRFVREPLIWLLNEDVVRSQEQTYRDDPYRTVARDLIELWERDLRTTESYRAKDILNRATKKDVEKSADGKVVSEKFIYPEWHDLLLSQCGDRGAINPKSFGNWLRALRNQPQTLDNGGIYRITVAFEDDKHGHRWKLQRVDPVYRIRDPFTGIEGHNLHQGCAALFFNRDAKYKFETIGLEPDHPCVQCGSTSQQNEQPKNDDDIPF